MNRAGTTIARASVIIGLVSLMVLGAASGGAGFRGRRVIGGRPDQWTADGSSGVLAWTQGKLFDERRASIFIRSGGERRRVTSRDDGAVLGSIDGTRLVYERYPSHSRYSDIWFYDISTDRHRSAGNAVNTSQWEKYSSVSGDLLLFQRQRFLRRYGDFDHDVQRQILYNLASGQSQVLDEARGNRQLQGGDIEGDWAVWGRCKYRCSMMRYNAVTEELKRIRPFKRPLTYGFSITSEGTVYAAESGYGCGTRVLVTKHPVGGRPRVVFSLRDKLDLSTTAVYDEGGRTQLLYDRIQCRKRDSDIFKATVSGGSPTSSPSPTPTETCIVDPVCPGVELAHGRGSGD